MPLIPKQAKKTNNKLCLKSGEIAEGNFKVVINHILNLSI